MDSGDNILIPQPGFSIYQCHSGSKGIETRPYRLIVSFVIVESLDFTSLIPSKRCTVKQGTIGLKTKPAGNTHAGNIILFPAREILGSRFG